MPYVEKEVSPLVFRAYDIRGVIDENFNEDAFYSIGKALSVRMKALNRSSIFLARDGRLTSERLAEALKCGLLGSGIDVIELGAVSSPVLYYATHLPQADSGLIVTASHNPAEYNGIKMVLAGKTLTKSEIMDLYQIIQNGQYIEGQGKSSFLNILDAYADLVVSNVHVARPFKIVVDCGNGIAGPLVPKVLERLGCEVIPLHCEVDGHFPNHHPDPTIEENLTELKDTIRKHQADIGLAFDGDADRLGVITETGEMIWPDRLMMFYARDLLKKTKNATIVFDVKCSSFLTRIIEQGDGVAQMCPTGHSIVKSVMEEKGAILAGEMSGHLFFKDRWFGFDDALYSACRLLELLSQSPLSPSQQFAQIPISVNTPEIKIPMAEKDKFLFMQEFEKKAEFPKGRVIGIDGLRVEFSNGWGLLRASNTTPCLIARFEAEDENALELIKTLFRKQINQINPGLELPF
ncbi:phosphomannomutase [Legionella quinlivanii]|uniref:phosphomannomutase n=1 Tax=Legionella quinlivanii TaxID=45073 RepID=A0A0W0XZG9_9GAMM|nr:phosphomannomutase/phosphoglucomutase [Legionella quinlivanii]KTD49716.1 phosphomannomutase [Legionella quinlivanii]SEG23221.1 phosphomannomutase / phosphoglucomutase [Legionella quinlivanii DSM 21216]STY09881.1 phosphomannomutase [Legionella quinlivanii]